MRTIVIYHKSDFDGIFCREIARKFLPEAELIGWDYGDPVPVGTVQREAGDKLYMLDISIDGLMDYPGLVWIDHHKSAIDKYPSSIRGVRIDGVAACRLAWQWFHRGYSGYAVNVPTTKEPYVERRVTEPYAVRLAGEYDIWDKRNPDAELFQHGLRSQELDDHVWEGLLDVSVPVPDVTEATSSHLMVAALLERGRAVQYAKNHENESIIKSNGFTVAWEGLTFLACNAARYNSLLFTAGVLPEHDALLGFNYDGTKGLWRVSLYHAPGKEHLDLSTIAVRYGGGGHRGACGFAVKTLPFIAA